MKFSDNSSESSNGKNNHQHGEIEIYDVIVVGGGHAGCEAASAAANMGMKVLLITMNMGVIAQMSCNPAMGGVAKGQIVREIDALGGYSGIVSDKTMIQFRMLNRSKGPAMWSPRCQSDRMRFADEWRIQLEQIPNIDFWQDAVVSLLIDDKKAKGSERPRISGVKCSMGKEFKSRTVILTNGTFLNGLIHIGEKRVSGGRVGEKASTGISEQLAELGFETGRMKTGTPPRIDGRTIDYSLTEIQEGDENPSKFSYSDETHPLTEQRPCHIAYTNPKVHKILEKGLHLSPMYSGIIKGIGPRYCPSIEDKIVRFSERERHQLFIEPEGWRTIEIYLNGFSSSLPEDIQYEALKLIPGFQNAKMFRPGYAIEYDFFPPHQLKLSLETQPVENLFFAGQINGTTGYEEAAAQGIIAGINAAAKILEKEPLILKRSEAYIGVLIDDLINKSTNEPYRMFTSRAEFRILLRQDNADIRLTSMSHKMGLASNDRLMRVNQKLSILDEIKEIFSKVSIKPEEINAFLEQRGEAPINQKIKLEKIILRPNINIFDLEKYSGSFRKALESIGLRGNVGTSSVSDIEILEQAEIQLKYAGYIEKEADLVNKMNRLEDVFLKPDFDYQRVASLSNEAKEKLAKVKPTNLGQASRISGVNPSDISALMLTLGR